MGIEREALQGDWLHSHEEDTESEMIYRPADRELPLARGRRQLTLHADGTFTESAPGPTDRPEEASGSWDLDEDRLVLSRGERGGETLSVAAAEPDRLVVRK
jgi:hypothetical protein